ncbi:MAG: ATP-binding protein [Sedimentisphaerales bacterium]|nr:ATP-binding protein [Sedimentisphaerales bacterium]
MRFLFETYKQHYEQGIEAHKQGDYQKAKVHYLMAAKYLCAMAKDTDAEFKQERLKKAQRLIEIAKELGAADKHRLTQINPADSSRSIKTNEDDEEGKADRWVVTNPPKTSFKDVAGLEDVKKIIKLRVIYPLDHLEVTQRFGKRAGGGVLLYGPPGTGKTMIARAIACELDATFMSIKGSDIMSKWVGSAEKNMRELFAAAHNYPRCVIFMDETESIVAKRGSNSTVMNRVIPEFLAQVDGLEKSENMLLLLGATNRPWDMDEAALRPGRFGELIYVPLPDEKARLKILEMNFDKVPKADEIDMTKLAERLAGYSGADIKGFIEAVTDLPYQRQIETGSEHVVTLQDIEQAMLRVKPSVDSKMLLRYEKYSENRQGG